MLTGFKRPGLLVQNATMLAVLAAGMLPMQAHAQLPGNQPNNGGAYTYVVVSSKTTLGGSNSGGEWYLSSNSGRVTTAGQSVNSATTTGASWSIFAGLYDANSGSVTTMSSTVLTIGVYGPVSANGSYGVEAIVGATGNEQVGLYGTASSGAGWAGSSINATGLPTYSLSWAPGDSSQSENNNNTKPNVLYENVTLYPVTGQNYFYGTFTVQNIPAVAEVQGNGGSGVLFGNASVAYTNWISQITGGPFTTSTFPTP